MEPKSSPQSFKAVLYGGDSHGSLLHHVPEHLPNWFNPGDQEYHFDSWLMDHPHKFALYLHGNPPKKRKFSACLREWKHLLSDSQMFKNKPKSTCHAHSIFR